MKYSLYMYSVVAASARACPLSVSREVTKMAQAVDLKAKEVGRTHRPPQGVIDALLRRIGCTTLVQMVYTEILVQRQEEFQRLQKKLSL